MRWDKMRYDCLTGHVEGCSHNYYTIFKAFARVDQFSNANDTNFRNDRSSCFLLSFSSCGLHLWERVGIIVCFSMESCTSHDRVVRTRIYCTAIGRGWNTCSELKKKYVLQKTLSIFGTITSDGIDYFNRAIWDLSLWNSSEKITKIRCYVRRNV